MKRVLVSGIVIPCILTAIVSAATRRVPGEYPRIQAAIQASSDGDVVIVSPGVYYETINFLGRDIAVTGTDPNDPKVVGYTIINAEEDGSAVTFENGESPAAVLTGFTITGGFGTLNNDYEGEGVFWGGGIYCLRSSPTITKNVIARNNGPFAVDDPQRIAVGYGGGVACIESSAVVTHNVIRDNSAYIAGGIIAYIGNDTLSNNVIHSNSAFLGGGAILLGGAMLNNTLVGNDCDLGMGDGMGGNAYIVYHPDLGYGTVRNNIICNAPSGGGLLIAGLPDETSIGFNNVWGNTPGDYVDIEEQVQFDGDFSRTGKAGNISEDPLFLNPFGRDYHLTLGSPCINAGDPDYVAAPGAQDIDGQGRVYGNRLDMGADEYVGYMKPVASAGPDRHALEPLQAVMLDGTGSFFYDPCAGTTFMWTQVSGPEADLPDPTAAKAEFVPHAYGEYVFQLVVDDGQYESEPDLVLILVAENQTPVADAGADRTWDVAERVILDGKASYDPDTVDDLHYRWGQVEGPPVDLEQADGASPFFAPAEEGRYVFELVVNDGFVDSEPSRVECVTVGVMASKAGVNVEPGQGLGVYQPDVAGTRVVYAVTEGFIYDWNIAWKDLTTGKVKPLPSTGMSMQPKIDGDLIVWSGGFSFTGELGPECTSVFVYNIASGQERALRKRSDTSSFSHPAISGNRVVWVQHAGIDRDRADKWHDMPYDICGADLADFDNPAYFTVATSVGRRDPIVIGDPSADPAVVDICGDLVVWEADGDIYAADISDLDDIRVYPVCAHPARQYGPAISGSVVVWTDERNDPGDIYGADLTDLQNIREIIVATDRGPQRLPTIDGPLVVYADGGASGLLRLACVTRKHGVLRTEFAHPDSGVEPVLNGRTLVWLRRSGGSVHGAAIGFSYSIFDGAVENVYTGERYDYVQHAAADANDGGEIVVPQGVHEEKIDFAGKALTVRSSDPNDPAVVAATVIAGDGDSVSFLSEEGAGSVLAGLTITGGWQGILCYNASPTITRCVIEDQRGAGIRLSGDSNPVLAQCDVLDNGGAGIEMSSPAGGRVLKYCEPLVRNCVIAGNRGQGTHGGRPTVSHCTIVENLLEGIDASVVTMANSIVYFNAVGVGGLQIKCPRATVAYSDVQGGWSGEGNIDDDPLFAKPGSWATGGWTAGDYHLMSQGWRWARTLGEWVSDDLTSPCVDAGDPTAELLDELVASPADPQGAAINHRVNMGAYGTTAEASLMLPTQ